MSRYYPCVLIPHQIKGALLEDFMRPVKPREPEQVSTFTSGCLLAFGLILSFSAFIQKRGDAREGLLVVVCIVAVLWLIAKYNEGRARKASEKQYGEQIKVYQQKLEAYAGTRPGLSKLFCTAEYRAQKLAKVLPAISRPLQEYKGKRGAGENNLYAALLEWFPCMIYRNYVLESFLTHMPYVPDIIFQDPLSNLHIDIEIDEPYSHDSGQPTHYYPDKYEDVRNLFFSKHGWIVIRFSEQQAC